MPFTYEFPRAALTVDCVIFGLDDAGLKVLLIERGLPPFRGRWALPGGFVRLDETLDQAARRELREETGVGDVYLEQFHAFGDLGRDPRERVVSVAYFALAKLSDHRIKAATDARAAAWFALSELPKLAFDHDAILESALDRLKENVRSQPLGFELLPKLFTLSQLQRLYEKILGRLLDKRNFRKKILGMELLVETDDVEQGVSHRAARLYRFDEKKYRRLAKSGFHFEL